MPCTVHRRMNVKLSIVDKMACNLKTDGHSYSCDEFLGVPSGETCKVFGNVHVSSQNVFM